MNNQHSATLPAVCAEANLKFQSCDRARSSTSRRLLTRLLFWCIALFAAGGIFYVYLMLFLRPPAHETLTALVAGTYDKPYVLRVLVPLVMRALLAVSALTIEQAATVVMLVSLLVFLPAFRYLQAAFDLEEWRRDLLTLAAVLGLTAFLFTPGKSVYDLTTLSLFTLALAFLARRRWLSYLAVFTLATINRETSILLLLVFLTENIHKEDLTDWRHSALWPHVLAQFAIYGVIRLAIIGAFWDNPGSLMQYHWAAQVENLASIPAWLGEGTATGWLLAGMLVAGNLLPLLTFYRWSSRPPFLRRAFLAMGPLLYVLFLIGGMPFESRVFLELYPLLILLWLYPYPGRLTAANSGV